MKSKKGVLVALLTSAALVLTGCASATPEKGGTPPVDKGAVAMSFGGLNLELWAKAIDLMKPKIEAAGYKFLYDDPQWDAVKQTQDWDAWIAQGDVKAIMGYPVQAQAIVPVTARANAAGIAVLGYIQNWDGSSAALKLNKPLEDGLTLGNAAGEWIVKQYGADAKVEVALLTSRKTALGIGRADGMAQGLKSKAPNVVINEIPALSREEGFNGAKSFLIAHPNTKVWLGTANDQVQGAYRAVLDSGVKTDDPNYAFGAMDVANDTLDAMALPNSNWRFGFTYPLSDSVQASVDLLLAAAEGKKPTDIVLKPVQVTLSNLKDFYIK